MRILVLVAGTNEPSNSNALADAMIEGMRVSFPETTIDKVRLKDVDIGHFNLSCYGPNCPLDGMTQVQSLMQSADGVVIATPMWNFSVPAHLKNLIDRMGSFALDASHSVGTFNGKPFFLIVTAGMPRTAWPFIKKTISHLPIAIQYFGGSVLGTFFEGGCTLGRGVFGLVVDQRPERLQAMKEKGAEFAKHVSLFKETGILPLKYRLIKEFVRLSQLIKKKLRL